MNDLHALTDWCDALLAKLEPAQRRQLARQIALELRRANAQRIAQQVTPEGEVFVPRKAGKSRDQRGKLRRPMFAKLRTARFLKAQAAANAATVGFAGRVGRIARVHQFGLYGRLKPGGPEYRYASRQLLGINEPDLAILTLQIERHLSGKAKITP
ncbi:phage virion morphogenesis protein [Chitinimonas arctica]|uniref:Phage virion morphogenesis protein n=1 Tax=Chitinimonas arctica TaxID=2594795 RepID=A0A516SLV4_9NEIS|nr:phage virion morphogenesis protein [Chitinimonas arctica]QDQ29133.1 phage virion morphogenesis protein [Chitinimonas arctica]